MADTPAGTDSSSASLPPGTSQSFCWLIATRGSEGFADSLSRTLLPIVAVSVLGMGTAYVGVLNALSLTAFLLLGIPIGSLIDSIRNKKLAMTVSSVTRVVALSIVAVLFLANSLHPAVLLLAALVIGVADVGFTTAESTVIPTLVPQDRLKQAYSRLAVVGQSASTLAAMVGSLMLSFIGIIGMISAAIASYIASVLFQRGIRTTVPPVQSQRARAKHLDGFRLLLASPALRALTWSAALTNAGVMLGNTILPVFVLADLAISPAIFAAMGVVSALAAITGSALSPVLTNRFGLRKLRVTTALLAGPAVLLTVFCRALPGDEIIRLMTQAGLWNLLVAISSVAGSDILPRTVPRERLASVGAAQRMITLGVMPIAALIGGIATSYTGTVAMLAVWAVLTASAALPIARARSLDLYR